MKLKFYSPLQLALDKPLWREHKIGNEYALINKDGSKDFGWKIAYYPIFEDGKTGKQYSEPRALIERPMLNGTDFRETPLRYIQSLT